MNMMAEPKPIASLSSGLLARKGAARPAMRRQGLDALGQMVGGVRPHPCPEADYAAHEDLGWNDMGYDVDPVQPDNAPNYGGLLAGAIPDAQPVDDEPTQSAPSVPVVVRQQVEIAEHFAEVPASVPAPVPADAAEDPAPVTARRVVPQPARSAVRNVDAAAIAAVPQGKRAAFTLRLDSERHLRLRLASAVTGQSAQQLVTAALDELLTKIPEIEDLAGRVPRPAGQ
jgi:hypothetical protein